MTPRRPGPLRWLWFAFGGALPERYRDWVLHDATCAGWRWRHMARAFVQMSPVAVPVLLLVPGPLWVRLCAVLLGWLVAFQYALFIMDASVDHRVRKAGFPAGAAEEGRAERTAEQRAAAAARYAGRYRR
ncbi:DUF5313 family protein [Pseudonocardia endophytica]|uniref:DUF5313 family protein n=1 Tax=Pseudonocardia endophytica TaxID=401976 RepID=UPI001A9FFBCD|nr:DUF5313 family protein [Pseudonocardia endophytica]